MIIDNSKTHPKLVYFFGGLGNQLFQYSFLLYMANVHRVNVGVDTSFYCGSNRGGDRKLEVQNIFSGFPKNCEKQRQKLIPFSIKLRIARRLWRICSTLAVEDDNGVRSRVSLERANKYVGYWQNQKYPESVEELLRAQYRPGDNLPKHLSDLVSSVEGSNSVGLHVRRGDYISSARNKQYFAIQGTSYYHRALEIVEEIAGKTKVFVFCDDLNWVIRNINLPNAEYVSAKTNSAEDDFKLMSMCKHNIIANSTFSWWAAWLNSNRSKLVIAPKRWLVNEIQNERKVRALIPQTWRTC